MPTIEFDLNDSASVMSFEDGWYIGTIANAEVKVSEKGNSYFNLIWEVQHPVQGTARMYDIVAPAFKPKARAFYRGWNGFTEEELMSYLSQTGMTPGINPDDLPGSTVLVHIGTGEDQKGNPRKETKDPYYAAQTETHLLDWQQAKYGK